MFRLHQRYERNWEGNKALFIAAGIVVAAYLLFDFTSARGWGLAFIIVAIMGVVAFNKAYEGWLWLWSAYRLKQGVQEAMLPRDVKDDHEATFEDKQAAGMFTPRGRILGIDRDGNLLWSGEKNAFSFYYSGQGGGKTSTSALASSILTPITTGKSIFINDIKKEVGPMMKAWAEALNIPILFCNIGSGQEKECPHTSLNPFEMSVDAYYSADPAVYRQCTKFMRGYRDIIVPDQPGATTQFFVNGAKAAFLALHGYQIIFDPDKATPSRLHTLVTDTDAAREALRHVVRYRFKKHDRVGRVVQIVAKSVLALDDDKNNYLSQFLKNISDGLDCYDQSGALADLGEDAVARISDMRKKQMIIVSQVAPGDLEDMSVHLSLMAYNFYQSPKMVMYGVPVHGLLDEFTSLRMPKFADEMILMRSMGLSAEIYVQSKSALVKALGQSGKEDVQTIHEQSDIWQYTAINSHEVAGEVSKLVGTRRVRDQNTTIDSSTFSDMRATSQDWEEPIFTEQELMALGSDIQIIKKRDMRPIIAFKVPWWEIDGLKQKMGRNPLEGDAPNVPFVAKLSIKKEGVTVAHPKPEKRAFSKAMEAPKRKKIYPVNAYSFVWLYLWLCLFPFILPVESIGRQWLGRAWRYIGGY